MGGGLPGLLSRCSNLMENIYSNCETTKTPVLAKEHMFSWFAAPSSMSSL